MAHPAPVAGGTVHTVLGPVPAADLGVVAVHDALLSVLPGAQHAPDISMDRAEIFDALATRLREFAAVGGGTVVDSTGMFHGRDLPLLEALSRTTGVHVVASTGMGPEELLGGYFLTPQTNPPTPWPAERFAELFTAEVTDGMVVPRLERRARAGLVTTATTRSGRTGTDTSLLQGAARTAAATGVPLTVRFGADAVADLDVVLAEGLTPDRVAVAGLDRADAAGAALAVAGRGARVLLDSAGSGEEGVVEDSRRVEIVRELVDSGHGDRVLLTTGAVGVGKGVPTTERTFAHLVTEVLPRLAEAVGEEIATRILATNPQTLLTVR